MVRGLPDVWVRLGRCCTPGAGRRDRGVRHARARASPCTAPTARTCKSLEREPERLIEVTWAEGKPTSFTVAIQVEALDRDRLLSDVAHGPVRHPREHPVGHVDARGRDRITRLRFTFELADIAHLSSVLAAVKRVDGVFDAYRVVPG